MGDERYELDVRIWIHDSPAGVRGLVLEQSKTLPAAADFDAIAHIMTRLNELFEEIAGADNAAS